MKDRLFEKVVRLLLNIYVADMLTILGPSLGIRREIVVCSVGFTNRVSVPSAGNKPVDIFILRLSKDHLIAHG